jgi:hypothetical protein
MIILAGLNIPLTREPWPSEDTVCIEHDTDGFCSSQAATCPIGTQSATVDVIGAYRTAPILPAQRQWLVCQHRNQFWCNTVGVFGVSSMSGVHGEIADAVVDIWKKRGLPFAIKWVDDGSNSREPTPDGQFVLWYSEGLLFEASDSCNFIEIRYDYDKQTMLAMIEDLGVPWHMTKGQDFDFIVEYVGFCFNLLRRTVSLPERKRKKFRLRVSEFINQFERRQAPLQDVWSLIGSLSHLTYVYEHGCSYLPALSAFSASYENKHTPRYPPRAVISDLRWWLEVLDKPDFVRSLEPRGPLTDLGIWVDASTDWGIGIIWDNTQWAAWKLLPGWDSDRWRHIGWAEGVAVELLAYIFEWKDIRNANILVRSDNKGVIGAFRKGRGKNIEVNASIRRAHVVLAARNITLSTEYVASKVNLADAISRAEFGPDNLQFHPTFELPEELASFIVLHEGQADNEARSRP